MKTIISFAITFILISAAAVLVAIMSLGTIINDNNYKLFTTEDEKNDTK